MKLEEYWKVHPAPRRLQPLKGQKPKYVFVLKGPFEITVEINGKKPADDDWRIATWVCNAINWAKQRTEEILEEQFGPDDAPSESPEEAYKKAVDEVFKKGEDGDGSTI